MIQPEAYYAAHKVAPSPEALGRLGFAMVGREMELDPPLSPTEKWHLATILRCNKWHTENRDAMREKWRDASKRRKKDDNGDAGEAESMNNDSVQAPSPTVQNASPAPVRRPNLEVGAGTENVVIRIPHGSMRDGAREFAQALRGDPDRGGGVFFNASYDPVVMCCAVTGDYHSAKRWRQLVSSRGEDVVREELFSFYRELMAGEEVSNRGAALNARLSRMETKEQQK